jgi:restriction endonuclease S subunit
MSDKPKKETKVKVKDLPKSEKELTPEERRKVKGGDWLMTPAGSAKPSGN